MFGSVGAATANVKAGKLTALGATGPARNPASAGRADHGRSRATTTWRSPSWFGIVAPAGDAGDVVAKLSADIQKVVKAPDTQARIQAAGFTATGTTREAFARIIANDAATWGKAVRATGFKAD